MIAFLPLLLNRFVIGAIAAALLAGGAYWRGYSTASAACHDAALRAQIATMQRDMAAWTAADDVERILTDSLEAERNRLAKEVTDYEAELAKRRDSRCVLGPDDVRRLRFGGQR